MAQCSSPMRGGARAWPTLRSAWLEVRGLLAKKKGIAAVGSKEQ
jgi:hypothetical protein